MMIFNKIKNRYRSICKFLFQIALLLWGGLVYSQDVLEGAKIVTSQYQGHKSYTASVSIEFNAGWSFDSSAEGQEFSACIGVTSPGAAENLPINTTPLVDNGVDPGDTYQLADYTPNYKHSINLMKKVTDPNLISTSMAKEDAVVSTIYADGMGRPLQSISRNITHQGHDVIQPIHYDGLGRQTKGYLSYVQENTNGTFQRNAIKDQFDFYNDPTDNLPDDKSPFSLVKYEDSPYAKVLQSFAPGKHYVGNNKGQSFSQRNNLANEVLHFTLINDKPFKNGYYTAGDLIAQIVTADITESEQNSGISYTNKKGLAVASKVQESGDDNNPEYNPGTYYVFDEYGKLRFILPPKAIEEMGTGEVTNDIINKYCFTYNYDNEHRLISKKVPGKGDENGIGGESYIVYDKWDRPILFQNAKQRTVNEWSFVKYDILGRKIYAGTFISTDDRVTLQADADRTTNPYTLHEVKGGTIEGYTNTAFPDISGGNGQVLSVSYYDDYSFSGAKTYDPSFDASFFGGNAPKVFHSLMGKATGSKIYVPEKGIWLFTQVFYDKRGRVFQIQTDNHLGGTNILLAEYNFAGKILKGLSKHTSNDGDYNETLLAEKTFEYDHVGRLLKVTQTINGAGTPEVIGEYAYNELGQLIQKKIGNAIQEIDFKYNFNGQLVDINDINDNLDGNGDLFALHFDYQEGFQKSRLDGTIAGTKWKSASDNKTRAYGYSYDKQGRLTRADYVAKDENSGNWDQEDQNYTVFGLQYDANGNVLQLKRQGLESEDQTSKTFGNMDRLRYTYDGNRLKAVDDLVINTAAAKDFNDIDAKYYDSQTAEYTYDDNGNLTSDVNKNISSIEYNTLDLPVKITFGQPSENKFITYLYDGTGSKLRKKIFDGNATTPIKTTDYVGGIVYENKKIAFMNTAEGRLVAQTVNGELDSSNGFNYEYQIKDHQGNQRISVSNAAEKYQATMEATVLETEKKFFVDLDSFLIHSNTLAYEGDYAALVPKANGSSMVGPSITLKVKKGDNVEAKVRALYFENGSSTNFTYGSSHINNPSEGSSNISGSVIGTSANGGGKPDAYLKMVFIPSSSSTGSDYENNLQGSPILSGVYYELSSVLDITEDGDLVIFLGNDDTAADVIFDNFTVSHTQLISQENHYYPGGMNLAGIEKYSLRENFYQYNHSTEKETAHGLNWYETPFRSFDVQLMRFHQIDKMAELYLGLTPYHYAGNDPINANDPTGLFKTWTGFINALEKLWKSESGTTMDGSGRITTYGSDQAERGYMATQGYEGGYENTGSYRWKAGEYIKRRNNRPRHKKGKLVPVKKFVPWVKVSSPKPNNSNSNGNVGEDDGFGDGVDYDMSDINIEETLTDNPQTLRDLGETKLDRQNSGPKYNSKTKKWKIHLKFNINLSKQLAKNEDTQLQRENPEVRREVLAHEIGHVEQIKEAFKNAQLEITYNGKPFKGTAQEIMDKADSYVMRKVAISLSSDPNGKQLLSSKLNEEMQVLFNIVGDAVYRKLLPETEIHNDANDRSKNILGGEIYYNNGDSPILFNGKELN